METLASVSWPGLLHHHPLDLRPVSILHTQDPFSCIFIIFWLKMIRPIRFIFLHILVLLWSVLTGHSRTVFSFYYFFYLLCLVMACYFNYFFSFLQLYSINYKVCLNLLVIDLIINVFIFNLGCSRDHMMYVFPSDTCNSNLVYIDIFVSILSKFCMVFY